MPTTHDLRAAFLDYFKGNGHHIAPSISLIPHGDSSLLFTNAGMVPFKNFFTGLEQSPHPRVAGCQKCIRAGGKHNDLDQVGHTSRHHTFFEMLGNFSFGDYFKEEAITLAWQLLTREFGLPSERLLVTVHASDQESAQLWGKIAALPERQIIFIASDDNFWQMGESGPCGPCSEIFYDHGEQLSGGRPGSPEQDGERFVEVWNLVFMQFELTKAGLQPLPRPSIDTGMGLERIAAVLQGCSDNYQTDVLHALITAGAEISSGDPGHQHRVAYRVIADHIRSIAFLIADGVLPSNERRGYVLRRIMRRAMRYAHEINRKEPLLRHMVRPLVELMGQDYPELQQAQTLIETTLELEEGRFRGTLERGLQLLGEELQARPNDQPLPGAVAFKLYDTYGFPLDLTVDILRSRQRTVEVEGFEQAMSLQRQRARQARSDRMIDHDSHLWWNWQESHGTSEFVGYHTEFAWGRVLALGLLSNAKTASATHRNDRLADHSGEADHLTEVTQAQAGERIVLLVNQTPFYAEAGGQLGDQGLISDQADLQLRILDTQKQAKDLIVHYGVVERGHVRVGEAISLRVNRERRQAIRVSHSAAHLLHQALREYLGEHVSQKGALVDAGRLRFDFSHPKAVIRDDLRVLEQKVTEHICANTPVATQVMALSAARASGARALFGEKYGDQVRVVTIGKSAGGQAYSIELCGGIHAAATGEIGSFRITGEQALAAGVRRIEALVGSRALTYGNQQESRLYDACAQLQVAPSELAQRIAILLKEQHRQETIITELRRQLTGQASQWRDLGGIRFCSKLLEDVPPRELKSLADELKGKIKSGIVVLITRSSEENKASKGKSSEGKSSEGKASLVVAVTSDLTERFNAVALARQAAEQLGGCGGGGRPELAQSGGPQGAMAQSALDRIQQIIEGNS